MARVLHGHKFHTMFGTLGFDDKGDFTGFEMWSRYRWENGTAAEGLKEDYST